MLRKVASSSTQVAKGETGWKFPGYVQVRYADTKLFYIPPLPPIMKIVSLVPVVVIIFII